jgi:hypothetical protein
VTEIVVIPFGFQEAAANFAHLGNDAMYALSDVLVMIREDMMRVTASNFESQGRRGGGSWKPLTPAWLRTKERRGKDLRIQFYDHWLVESVTVLHADHQIADLDEMEGTIRLGSTLPYADTAQRHRPYLKFTRQDQVRWGKWVQGDLHDKWARRARQR